MNAQLCEYTKNYTGHFKWVNFKGYEIYLKNKIKKDLNPTQETIKFLGENISRRLFDIDIGHI